LFLDPMTHGRISTRCYIVQDWNHHKKSLRVFIEGYAS
jgi:hypothetical protein